MTYKTCSYYFFFKMKVIFKSNLVSSLKSPKSFKSTPKNILTSKKTLQTPTKLNTYHIIPIPNLSTTFLFITSLTKYAFEGSMIHEKCPAKIVLSRAFGPIRRNLITTTHSSERFNSGRSFEFQLKSIKSCSWRERERGIANEKAAITSKCGISKKTDKRRSRKKSYFTERCLLFA